MMDAMLVGDLASELPQAVRLQRLVSALRTVFACGAVAVLRLEGETLRPVAVDGLVKEALGRRFRLAQHPRLATLIDRGREPVCFEHDSRLPDPYDGLLNMRVGEPLPVHDCMGSSLHVNGQLWGVITLDALEPGTFGPQAVKRLRHYTLLIEAAIRMTGLEEEVRSLRMSCLCPGEGSDEVVHEGQEIIGSSEVIAQLLHELDVVADSELPVLLLGETGVGKELFARRLHQRSRRRERPLVHVNCAALPESLAESELFGHCKGAFSGATGDRPGKFEAADGGTLFLDEVGELPLGVQAKLLRALQNGEIQRLGEDQPRQVDVRIIAATNRHLDASIKQGDFRADLYHRLSVYPVPIPPLRERGQDILLLAGHFLELNRARLGLRALRLSPAAERALLGYPWPGNVRELEHVISRAALKAISQSGSRSDMVTLEPVWLDLDSDGDSTPRRPDSALPAAADSFPVQPLREQVEACQREAIQRALEAYGNNWAAAARQLELDASNLHKLARRLGLK